MTASQIIFYTISGFILTTGLLSVTSAKIFRSAIWLLFSLVGIAGLYFWMNVEFVAAVQIVVYVGGIVVLIIFSIFLTQESGKEMFKPSMRKTVFSVLSALLGFGFTYNLISKYGFPSSNAKSFNVPVSEIGTQMLSTTDYGYILPFEVVSMLLLASMIGCIIIAMKSPEQQPSESKKVDIEKKENTPPPTIVTVPETLIIEEV
jgi:NADH-quinone oxidoreductase subunit J